jgi:DNA end-binding protein Ku
MELIEAKRNSQEVVTTSPKEPKSNVTDLMAALQASIDQTRPGCPLLTALFDK